jgi:polyisoprenoid-binding protein YceI
VKKHPKARFTSTSIDRTEKGHRITGNLTFLGVTRPVSFSAAITTGDALRLDGAVAINRRDFGMTYGTGKIDDTVEVRFNVDARR